jgi:DNA-directed RNA polymerase subunit RPC12/RpoP
LLNTKAVKAKRINRKRGGVMAEARCMRCKKQVEVKDPKDIVMKNGMKAITGVCPQCSTKVFKIVGKS